ncbi:hypothetical protein TRFO_27821 [Tritrichomonas foetus]|uniref:PPPDE domain-containing protein n=1 Tax=Tritrichomonas foetus TaxID=1144522 RepID=A0A1J4K1F5_9EUKA|nr:hypothetical protein TRFO_27821 [Tritrichomonas foetus]|eukprot:OHT04616.1 hypothetical protein TRFO_27821 [Tritrichomonas foetus]
MYKNKKDDDVVKIRLNIFDLTPLNQMLRFCHVGVYHSSIVIGDSSEYYFGFAAINYTGIDSPERIDHLPSSMTGKYYTTVELGSSPYSLQECRMIVTRFRTSRRWLSDHYNFLFHNCNTFTYELASALLGNEIVPNYPKWLSRGEKIGQFLYQTSVIHIFELGSKRIPGLGYIPEGGPIKIITDENLVEPNYLDDSEESKSTSNSPPIDIL